MICIHIRPIPTGKEAIEDNVREAFNQGLEFVAISDHGPGHLFYGINQQ